jgi:uncharacterized protein YbbC (DUF1343 family)
MIMNKQENSIKCMAAVQFGIDHLLTLFPDWKTARIGLVTNNAATTSDSEASRAALVRHGFNLVRLFSPEHGLSTAGADGVAQPDGVDGLTGLQVISLYGDHFHPTKEELTDLDLILFDIPDAGCRFYTYLWTLTHVMEACAEAGKKLIVLDRPNPLSGSLQKTEGPLLDETHCASFIGRWTIPVRHSCTLGELALYFKATRVPALTLEVIKMLNWNRQHTVDEAGWLFVPTSPAIRDTETIALYPATCFLEGVNVNEGRGTAEDFKVCGAPWMDGDKITAAFNEQSFPGITAMAIRYTPDWGEYAGEACQGMRFRITDEALFRPVKSGIGLLTLLKKEYPAELMERLYITAANPTGKGHLDRLTGVYQAYSKIENGELASTLAATDLLIREGWQERIGPSLLY